MKDFNKCFGDVKTEEKEWLELKTDGSLPGEIKGRLLRIGPAQYKIGKTTMNHWFDGFGHIYGFKFENGKVYFKNSFLQTESYKESIKKNKNMGLMFGTNPDMSLKKFFGFLKSLPISLLGLPSGSEKLWDNANVNIIPNKDKNFLALTEVTQFTEFDRCLNTLKKYKYNKFIAGQATTAHPQIDSENLYNIIIDIRLITQIKVIQQNKKTEERKVLKKIFRFSPAYFHSFAQTEKYLIVIEQPMRMLSPALFAFTNLTFFNNYSWMPSLKNKVTVIEKNSGKVLLKKKVSPFFFFHTTNGYCDGNVINIELAAYKDMKVLKDTMMKNLYEGKVGVSKPAYKNLKIDLDNQTIEEETMGDVSLELQRINERYKNKKHRFVYGIGTDDVQDPTIAFRNIVKYDIQKNISLTYNREDTYFGEPVFINKEKESSEDDGYLLFMGIDTKIEKSILVCLDAKTMKEKFSAKCNKIVPHGFHGAFVNEL